MDITSKFYTHDIVDSDIGNIKIDERFKEQYKLTDFDTALIKSAILNNSGMTPYQCQNFVANSQITPYKQVRQSLMELEVRYHSFQEIRNSLRKSEIGRRKMLKQMEASADPDDKELFQIDIEKLDYDITIYKRKFRQAEIEINAFLDVIKKYVKNDEDLAYYTNENPEEERKYWIARMGKQAALDIISFGRVGSGNMDSIAMMAEEDQLACLTLAVEYSGMVNAGMHKISVTAQADVEKYLEGTSSHIAQIMESLTKDENIQLTNQPQTNPESI